MAMLVEVAICTRNRADLLSETLESLQQMVIPPDIDWRLLVVDNGSVDHTSRLLDRMRERLPIHVLVEYELGHCHARNRAIAASQGNLILWTDDDVRVERNWLNDYVCAANEESDVAFWGGHIEPVFKERRPSWIEENWPTVRGCFAYRDLGDQPIELTPERLPYGANFAVRGEVQRRFLFDTRRGRVGNQVVGGDDIDLLQRLLAAGYRGRWRPNNRVWHVIPPERATENYVFRYFEGQGRELVRRNQPWTHSRWRLRGAAAWHAIQYFLNRPFRRSPVWVAHLVRWGLARGQLIALRSQ